MAQFSFRPATANDAARLGTALAALAQDIGDPYRATDTGLARALEAPCPSAWAHLAEWPERPERPDGLAGVVMYAPMYSTAQGGPGVYVSDLWVDAAARGQGLGRALLARAAHHAGTLWGAGFMRLVVHDHNAHAAAVYRKLGFAAPAGHTTLALTGAAFHALGDPDESHP